MRSSPARRRSRAARRPPSFEGAEVEPSLAADPKRRGRLVAVYQQDRFHGGGARGIVAAASTDGGGTWLRKPPAGERVRRRRRAVRERPVGERRARRPDLRLDALGRVSVTTSADWGRSWSTPVQLRGQYGLTDKEAVTADPRRKPGSPT